MMKKWSSLYKSVDQSGYPVPAEVRSVYGRIDDFLAANPGVTQLPLLGLGALMGRLRTDWNRGVGAGLFGVLSEIASELELIYDPLDARALAEYVNEGLKTAVGMLGSGSFTPLSDTDFIEQTWSMINLAPYLVNASPDSVNLVRELALLATAKVQSPFSGSAWTALEKTMAIISEEKRAEANEILEGINSSDYQPWMTEGLDNLIPGI